MRAFSKRRRRTCGFTLLEVLVSLAILSMIVATLYGSFFMADRAVEGVEQGLVNLHEARSAMDMISREVESAYYSDSTPRSVFTVEDREIFGKKASTLTMSTFVPSVPGLSVVSYYIDEKDGRKDLVKSISTVGASGNAPNEAVLIEDIGAFSVEVRDGNDKEPTGTWSSSASKKPPALVRVTLEGKFKDRPLVLSLESRPRAGRVIK